MVGCILVAHGRLAQAFLDVAVAMCDSLDAVRALGLDDVVDERSLLRRLQETIKEVNRGDGVLIFTDMFGGTPSHVCFSLLQEPGIEVITGLNLPMLIKFLTVREVTPLREIVAMVVGCGREDIYSARDLLDKVPR